MDSKTDNKKKHKYFTRSKEKIDVSEITKTKVPPKKDLKNFNKNIKLTIKETVKSKAIFADDDPDDADNVDDEITTSESSDDLDEHGNIKGLIDYDYDPELELDGEDSDSWEFNEKINVKQNKVNKKQYSELQKDILKKIKGGIDEDIDDEIIDDEDDEEYRMKMFNNILANIAYIEALETGENITRIYSPKKIKKSNGRYQNRMILKKYNYQEREYFESLSQEEKDNLIKLELNILEQENDKVPMRFQILSNDMPIEIKTKILNKLEMIKNIDKSNSEYYKIKNWVDGILKIPFGKYCSLPITLDDGSKAIKEYLVSVYKKLDSAVYGHNIAKTQLIQVITRWITNPSSKGFVLGIQGPPGNGKTTLVRQGISKAINKPFAFLTLGGATDASFLEGHSYTYEGSIPGRIVQILGEKNVKCMNPIIYFDELDKVSDTSRGHEIHNILCHLTDFSQNDEFHDKYYAGINFDLSKALFVFSFNDESLINPILKDRMTIIRTKGFKSDDKIKLGRKYLLPELFLDVKMDDNLIDFGDDVLKYIIEKYTDEMGVRNFKRCLEKIISKLNVIYLLGDISDMDVTMDIIKDTKKIEFPIKLTKNIVDNLLTSQFEKDDNTSRSHFAMYM